jgi:hypothetical protein
LTNLAFKTTIPKVDDSLRPSLSYRSLHSRSIDLKHEMKRRSGRVLALERLEQRAVPAALPIHAVLPTASVEGATLLPDGSIEIFGSKAHYLGCETGVDPQGAILIGGNAPRYGPAQWTIDRNGALADQRDLDIPTCDGGNKGFGFYSPSGEWAAGVLPPTVPGEAGTPVIWQRGTTTYIPIGLPDDHGGNVMIQGISDTGRVIYWLAADDRSAYYAWDRETGFLPLESSYTRQNDSRPDAARFALRAISADGRTIVGTSGGGSVTMQATVWRDGVPTSLAATTDAGALSVSDDGRAIGGFVTSDNRQQAAVWFDGNLTVLTDAQGKPPWYANAVTNIATGVGGDPNNWVATGNWWWLAGSDGIAQPLYGDYLENRYGISLGLGNGYSTRVMADDEAVYLVINEKPSHMCAGFNCYTSGKDATHLFVLPHGYQRLPPSVAYDLSGDDHVTALDALIVINAINQNSSKPLIERPQLRSNWPGIDVNGDGELSAIDALRILNYLNDQPSPTESSANPLPAEGEGGTAVDESVEVLALAADEYFEELAIRRRRGTAS